MTDTRKKRMSMLDNLANVGTPAAAGGSMMASNRALRSARDAVDSHHVWEIDPGEIEDSRLADRLDPEDVADLRRSIELNGQTVPILVRRDPDNSNRYLLVYGRRRLEAIRGSDKVTKVRALIANIDDTAALRAQVSENTGRRDLSYIERALFAQELLEAHFGSQAEIAEVLNATRSAVSMALSVARAISPDLARAIGPAHGIGRPRWEALVKAITEARADQGALAEIARAARDTAGTGAPEDAPVDASVEAFEAVARHLKKTLSTPPAPSTPAIGLSLDGRKAGSFRRTAKGVRLDLTNVEDEFATWLEGQAQDVLEELHARWRRGS